MVIRELWPMDELAVSNTVGYALGTVLAGYLFLLPFWLLSRAWNALRPARQINPWYLPLAVMVMIYLAFFVSSRGLSVLTMEDKVVTLGLLPGLLGGFVGARRFKRPKQGPTLDES